MIISIRSFSFVKTRDKDWDYLSSYLDLYNNDILSYELEEKMGGNMLKKIILLVMLSIYMVANEKIVIYYGVRRTPGKFYYEFKELTTKKLEISENKLVYYSVVSSEIEIFWYEIQIKDYKKIKKMAEKTIKKSKLTKCNEIINTNYGVSKIESIRFLKPVNSIIILDDKDRRNTLTKIFG